MKKSFFAFLLTITILVGCQSTKSTIDRPALPTIDDYGSVLLLRKDRGEFATGFLHLRNDGVYLVTARHFAGFRPDRNLLW